MKQAVLTFLAVFLLATPAMAKDLLWDRNTESDMSHYNAAYCQTKGCIVATDPATVISPNIPQVAAGVVPKFTLPNDVEGTVAVTATDTSGNKSGLSVAVPFDAKAPGVPANPRLQ